jgi:hypothetical protein
MKPLWPIDRGETNDYYRRNLAISRSCKEVAEDESIPDYIRFCSYTGHAVTIVL